MLKATCKACVADLGLDWYARTDVYNYWSDTEFHWNRGVIVCPAVHTEKGAPYKRDLHKVEDEWPPEWCPYGFINRVRELTHESI